MKTPSLAPLLNLLLMFAALASDPDTRRLWQIGTKNAPPSHAEFSGENGLNDLPPGKVTRLPGDPEYNAAVNPTRDDDFYAAGNYPGGFNGLTAPLTVPNDEPAFAWERALTKGSSATGGDRTNRFHFPLGGSQALPGRLWRLSYGFASGGVISNGVVLPGYSEHWVVVRLKNSLHAPTVVSSNVVTSAREFTVDFTADSAGATAGPNTLEFVRVGPELPGRSHFINFDYVKLEQLNTSPVLGSVAGQTVTRFNTLLLSLTATDDITSDASLVFSKLSGPPGLTVSAGGLVEWTPGAETARGLFTVQVSVRDDSSPSLSSTGSFTVFVLDPVVIPAPQIVSTHPIRTQGTVRMLASATGETPFHYQWYQGISGDMSLPVGTDSTEFTTPHLAASTPYWVRATDSHNVTGDSAETTVEVLPGGVRIALDGATASYTQFGDPNLTLSDPDNGIWSPGNQSAEITWTFDAARHYLLGEGGRRADVQFWITSPPDVSLGSLRLKYSMDESGDRWELLEFGGAECSDGAVMFQQNQPYFTESTLQIITPAAPVRTTYRVYMQRSGAVPSDWKLRRLRLESVKGDPNLPADGPGRGANGYFELSEVAIVDWSIPPAPPAPFVIQATPILSGTPFELHVENGFLPNLVPGYEAHYEWYQGLKGDLSHLVGETGVDSDHIHLTGRDAPTSYWVRLSTVNGVTDSDAVLVPMQANAPPVLAAVPPQQVRRYKNLQLTLSATDDFTPTASLVFSKVSGPAGLTVSPAGLVEWTPGAATAPGSYPVTMAVTDDSTPPLTTQGEFTVQVVNELLVAAPQIVSRHPIRPQGTVRLLAPTSGGPFVHFQWYEGLTEDTSKPVGSDSEELTTPHLANSTPYWVHVTDANGDTGDSPETTVEVLAGAGARIALTSASASSTQVGDPNLTLADPDGGIWSPGSQSASIEWSFDPNPYLLGAGGRADVQFWITSPPHVSLGSWRLKYHLFGGPWELLQFGGGSTSDGSAMFQQNQPYFTEPTLQITAGAQPVRTTYRVFTQVSAIPSKIMGFRLEAVKGDPNLIDNGPGRGANGYFELSEVAIVDWSSPPIPPAPLVIETSPIEAGTPFELHLGSGSPMNLAADYDAHYEWYQGAKGDLSHLVAETGTDADHIHLTGLDAPTSYWVRLSTVNGVTDSDAVLVPMQANAPPVLAAVPPQQVLRYKTLRLALSAADDFTPAASLMFAKVSGPAGLQVSPSGAVEWTPGGVTVPGSYPVTVSVTDGSVPALQTQGQFTVLVVDELLTEQPQIVSRHPIRPQGTVRLLAPTSGGPFVHFQWYEGLTEDTSKPVGADAPEFTTPRLDTPTPYWVHLTDTTGHTGDSPETIVEVLPAEGARVAPYGAGASYTQFGDPGLTISDPDNGIWAPGNQSASIDWYFNPNAHILGAGGRADVEFWITSPANVSLGSFRLKYTTAPDSSGPWELLQFGGGSTSDGSTIFQQNQPYFTEPTLQITTGAAPVRTTYRVTTQVSAIPSRITSLRLEAAKGDPHLPANGPGRGENGYFELSEVAIVDWSSMPQIQAPLPDRLLVGGTPFNLRVPSDPITGYPHGLASSYQSHFEWYMGERGDLSHLIGETDHPQLQIAGLDITTSFWVRMTTVNGTVDSETGQAVVHDLTLQLVPSTECHQGEVLVPLRVRNFSLVSALQGAIRWDPSAVTFVGVEGSQLPGWSEENLSVDPVQGTLRLAWHADVITVGGITVPDDSDLITLRIKLTGSKGSQTSIALSNDPVPWKIFGLEATSLTPVLGSAVVENLCPTLISGDVHYFSASAPVPGIQISLSDAGQGTILALDSTTAGGVFQLDVPEGQSGAVVVSPPPTGSALGESPTKGITMLDTFRIREHLLGLDSLAAPYELLAADVDRSGDVTIGDMLRVSRLVQWGDPNFGTLHTTNAGSWRFASSQNPPPNPASPWNWPALDTIAASLLNAAEIPDRDFVAIKIGDVNGSWDPGSGESLVGPLLAKQSDAAGQIHLQLDRQLVEPGGTVRMVVRSSATDQLTTAQFSLNWDPAVLRFAGVEGFGLRGLDAGNFGTDGVSAGALTLGWDDPQAKGVLVAEDQALFTVVYTVVGGPGNSSQVRITDRPTLGELSVRGRVVPFSAVEGLVAVRGSISGPLGMLKAASGQIGLWFDMPTGGQWVIETSEDLRHWVPLTEPAAASGGGLTQVMVPGDGDGNHFYRVTFFP